MAEAIKGVLCLDIDGTLTDHQEKIHPDDIRLLNDFPRRIQPIITTGRHLPAAKGVLQSNGIFQDRQLPLPLVLINGGAAYFPGEKLFLQHTFSEKVLDEITQLARQFQGTTFGFFSLDTAYLVNPTPFSRHLSKIHYLSSQECQAGEIPAGINKVMVMERDLDKIQNIKEKAKGINAEIATSLPYLLEFNPKGVNKPVTLLALLEELALEDIPIYAAGDGQNDMGLFKLAEKSFAPSTAHPAILKKADHIIQREQEGLLQPIIRMLLA